MNASRHSAIAAREIDQVAENAGNAGDAAGEQHQQRRGKADECAADRSRDRIEGSHVASFACAHTQ